MTNNTKILVIGRQIEILNKVVELINKNTDYSAAGAFTDEEAVRLFKTGIFGLIIFGGGIEPESDKKLRNLFISENPAVKIIQHFGGGSGLLYNEIRVAMESV
jgi:hypothetical protein